MRFFKKILFLVLLLFLFSCNNSSSPGGFYSGKYIEFKYPSGWKITDTETYQELGYETKSITIEKIGWNESGVVMIMTLNFIDDKNDFIDNLIEELDESWGGIFNVNLINKYNKKFKGNDALYAESEVQLLGMPFLFEVYALHQNTYTHGFVKFGAIEDTNKNEKGFDTIENNLRFK